MKLRLILLLALTTLFGYSASAQWAVGMRDTRYINVNYTFAKNWNVKFEQSIYAEKIGFQYFRLYASYNRSFGRVSVKGEPYYGMTYNNNYRNLGLNIDGKVEALKWLAVRAGFTPHYDSGLGYKSLYAASLEFNCTKQIAVLATATNRPEYRMPENRIRGGFRFKVKNLFVQPEISIPVNGDEGRNIRFLASMGYTF